MFRDARATKAVEKIVALPIFMRFGIGRAVMPCNECIELARQPKHD